MSWRAVLLIAAFELLPSGVLAGCGSDHCPIDLGMLWQHSRLTLDLTQQYLDQNQPRAGTHDTAPGTLAGEEDEIRTVSRITTARAIWQPGERWSVTASLPYVSRYHEHIMSMGGAPVLQRWNFSGLGDLEGSASRVFTRGGPSATRYHLTAGVKAPTGARHVEEVDGEELEPSACPGNGAWGAMAGAGAQWSLRTKMPGGSYGSAPIRLSVLGRASGRGTERYRVGSELQTNLGVSYPITPSIEMLLSGDLRVHAKDDPGDTDAEAGHTGGTWAFVSPGIRINAAAKTAFYGIVQLPVYQRVNGINLVSDYNLYLGVSQAAF